MTIDVAGILKTLQAERAKALQEVAKIDKAIESLRELSGANSAASTSGHGRERTMSAAARRKIADAQKARWAKFRKEQKAKE